jgi:hypothetical protein
MIASHKFKLNRQQQMHDLHTLIVVFVHVIHPFVVRSIFWGSGSDIIYMLS